MLLRNLTAFRLPLRLASELFDAAALEATLAAHRLRPVGALELQSQGFVSPYGDADAEPHTDAAPALVASVGHARLLAVGAESRVLPAAAVNAELARRVTAKEQAAGRPLGNRARRQLREDLLGELLPRALVVPSRRWLLLDPTRGLVWVDSASRKASEAAVSLLRHALGSLPALPLAAEVAPRAVLSGWLAGEPLPTGFALGDEVELRDPADHGAIARLQRQDLASDEVRQHLQAGKQATRIGLAWQDRAHFSLGEDLVLRKFSLLDAALGTLDGESREARAELDARLALFAGELGEVFDALAPALHFSQVDA
jgi:recombination associated protein RdgC